MLELNFVFAVFCLTVIALTAIRYGKEDVAMKALATLSKTTKGFLATFTKDRK